MSTLFTDGSGNANSGAGNSMIDENLTLGVADLNAYDGAQQSAISGGVHYTTDGTLNHTNAEETAGRIVDAGGRLWVPALLMTFLTGVVNISVGLSAVDTFPSMVTAFDWLKTQSFPSAEVNVLVNGKYAPRAIDDHMGNDGDAFSFSGYRFAHKDAHNIHVKGISAPVNPPTITTGTREAALVEMHNAYASAIYLHGNDDLTGTYGFATPYKLGSWENVAIASTARYGFDMSFDGAHQNKKALGGHTRAINWAMIGGVWGLIGYTGGFTAFGGFYSSHQISGGPVKWMNGEFRAGYLATDSIWVNSPSGVRNSETEYAKYGMDFSDGCKAYLGIGKFKANGSFAMGIRAIGAGTYVFCDTPIFTGLGTVIRLGKGARWDGNHISMIDCDYNNIQRVPASLSGEGYGNNIPAYGALISLGEGAHMNTFGGSANGCKGRHMFQNIGGTLKQGFNDIAVDDCHWLTSAYNFSGCGYDNLISVTITNPQAGSVDSLTLFSMNGIRLGAYDGLSLPFAIANETGIPAYDNTRKIGRDNYGNLITTY